MSKGKIAVGAIFGAVAGFVAGVLSAPKSGKETRADIKDAAVKAKDTAVSEVSKAKDVAEKKAHEVKAKAEEIFDDAKTKAQEVVEDVTEKASDIKSRTEQAVEGAKKGYAKKPKSTKKQGNFVKKTTKKAIQKVKKDNEAGARRAILEDLFYDFNSSRKQVFIMNFFRGIFFGLGSVLGGTIVIALVVWILSLLADIPGGIGDFVQYIVDIVQRGSNGNQ